MYCFAQVCRACIKNDGKLIKIHDLDIDNVSFYTKLSLCLPNIIFQDNSMKTYLCQSCSNILRKMYDFRESCMKSERILKAYVIQLEEANAFNNSEKNNLKELIDNNYRDLTMMRKGRPKSSELELQKFNSEIDVKVIKTETLDFEYVDVERFGSYSLLDIRNEPLDIKPDLQDYSNSAERTDEKDNQKNANKDFSIQSPNTSETSEIKLLDSSKNRHKCDVCSKSFNFSSKLQRHYQIHTEEKIHKCNICNKTFNRLDFLHRHTRIHTGEKPYECDICNKIFSQSISLHVHKRIHTGERPYKCDQCSKSFNRSDVLQIHMRIHTGEKPYACDICSKRFNKSGNLLQHKRIHVGEKPYECNVCNKSFIQKGNLQLHQRVHTGEKPFGCDVCTKSFSRLDVLQVHKRTHTGEKPYECDICSKSFNRLDILQAHKRTHTGEKPYKCAVCNKSFNRSLSLRRHNRIHISDKQ